MKHLRFPVARHVRQLERQWSEIDDYRRDLVVQFTIGHDSARSRRAKERWLQLGEVQQHLDAAATKLEQLTRLT